MARELCSEHGNTCDKVFKHESQLARNAERLDMFEENIGRIFTRLETVEGVQKEMVQRLEVAAQGLRALATKIDDAVTAAKNGNGGNPSPVAEPKERKRFTDQLNEAWDKFTSNFALFVIYSLAGSFVWAMWKTISGDWKGTPAWIKAIIGG